MSSKKNRKKPAARPDAKPAAKTGSSKSLVIWAVAVLAVLGVAFLVTRPAAAVMKDVDSAGAQKLISQGVRIVDVRTQPEYQTGHLDGAENVPIDTLTSAAAGWNREKPVLVYCATGARSLEAAQWMAANGFRKVYNLTGGIAAWPGKTTTDIAKGPNQVPTNGTPVFLEFSSAT